MSRFVGQDGRILSFEPTEEYRNILKLNIETNNIKNVSVYDFGLSDKEWEAEIGIGDSSATMHWVGGTPQKTEKIVLKPLDNIIESLNLEKIDFIKIDVDGHEPAFLKGAWNTIERYKPTILLEISHANYLKAGVYAWDFFHDLRQRGFHIYSEKDMKEYSDVDTFLFDCGNFNKSANIIIKK
jgi:FkbM family methyltransferase